MPRIAGVSRSSVTRPILLSLRPISVARCEWWRRIALPVCSTLIIFAALAIVITPKSARSACCLFSHDFSVAADAARLQGGHLDVAAGRNRAWRILMLQRVEGGANHVVGVRRSDRLRHHVLNAKGLEHRAHRTAGDDAGTRRCSAQVNPPRAVTAGDIVMQRTAFAQCDAGQVAFRRLGCLADGFGNFARLAVAESDPALLIADDDQGRKAEALAALDHLRHTIDVNELVDELAVALFPAAPVAATAFAFTCHGVFRSLKDLPGETRAPVSVSVQFQTLETNLLEAEPAFTRGIRERLDAAVIEIAAAIEHHFLDAVLHGAFRQQLADSLGRVDVGTGVAALAHRLLQRRSRRQRLALQVVDDLRIDVLRRAEYRQPRTAAGGTTQRQPHALLAPGIRNLESRHDRLRYFFLPSLRKINSSEYFTPLPL